MLRVLLLAASLCSTASRAAELTLQPSSQHVILVEVNGQPLRLRVDLGGFAEVVLNPEAAQRANLRSSTPLIGMIGPVKLRGYSTKGQLSVAGTRKPTKFIWFNRNAIKGADGIIGPWLLPYDRVDLVRGPPRPGMATTNLPIRFDSKLGIFYDLPLDELRIPVRASLIEEHTTSTAAAGAIIAARRGGAWVGPPRPFMVRWGVERPIRPLRLERPIAIGGLGLSRLLVRTSDFRGNHQLPSDQPTDPNEIVVTGARPGQKALIVVTLARDLLSSCSLISYSRKPRQISLTC